MILILLILLLVFTIPFGLIVLLILLIFFIALTSPFTLRLIALFLILILVLILFLILLIFIVFLVLLLRRRLLPVQIGDQFADNIAVFLGPGIRGVILQHCLVMLQGVIPVGELGLFSIGAFARTDQ